jgi:hypothetical protein
VTSIDWKSKREINEVVETIAFSKVQRFYPTIVNKVTDIPLEKTFDYLLTLVQDGELNLKWEIKCPHYDCLNTLLKVENIDDYLGKTIECEDCYREILIKRSIVFPTFEVNDEYREYIRDNKKKRKNPLKTL